MPIFGQYYDANPLADWLSNAYLEQSKFQSYDDLADAAGLDRTEVRNLASKIGEQNQPNRETVISLATALGKAKDKDINRALFLAGHEPLYIENSTE